MSGLSHGWTQVVQAGRETTMGEGTAQSSFRRQDVRRTRKGVVAVCDERVEVRSNLEMRAAWTRRMKAWHWLGFMPANAV